MKHLHHHWQTGTGIIYYMYRYVAFQPELTYVLQNTMLFLIILTNQGI